MSRLVCPWLAVLFAGLLFAGPSHAQDGADARNLPYSGTIDWDEESFGVPYEGDGWRVIFRRDGEGDDTVVTASVTKDDGAAQSFRIADSAFMPRGQIGLYPLEERDRQNLVVTYYSGGAHCCSSVYLFRSSDGSLEKVDFGSYDGGGPGFEDVDNDGVSEIVTVDQRFLYFFDSYAASVSPIRLGALGPEGAVDVTDDPRYRPYLRQEFTTDLTDLLAIEGEFPQGVAAGLVARGAQLGVWRATAALLPDGILSSVREGWPIDCPEDICADKRSFSSLGEALETILPAWGYPKEKGLSDDALAFLRPGEQEDTTCEDGSFAMKDGPDAATLAFTEGAQDCTIESALLGRTTAMTESFCASGDRYAFRWDLFEKVGDTLRRASWTNDPSEALARGELPAAPICPARSGTP